MDQETKLDTAVNSLTFFAASGTLVCCAIPILLTTIGMGVTVAAATSNFPILVTLSDNKAYVFVAAGVLLGVSMWLLYRPGRACPVDPILADYCHRAQLWNRRLLWGSATVWSVGFAAAYLALPLRLALDK